MAFVAFSPLARGFLGGALRDVDHLDQKISAATCRVSRLTTMPPTCACSTALRASPKKLGCTPAQLSLAWLLAKGEHIVPIPGTTDLAHLQENMAAADVTLDAPTVARLDALINRHTVIAPRYNAATQGEIDTEEFGQ